MVELDFVVVIVVLLLVTEVLMVVDVLEDVIVEVVELPPGLISVSTISPEFSLMNDHGPPIS